MRPLPSGIYTAVPTFFDDEEELDLSAFEKHVQFVSNAGTVPVVLGTMGEACHLTAQERIALIKAARKVLDRTPETKDVPLIAGVGAPSTRESVRLAKDAAAAGADYVMVIPPGYYANALQANDMMAIKKFLVDVSEGSPVPLIIYNFPAVSSGIDMDSSFIVDVVKSAPNVCGAKFTCANVSKIGRVTSALKDQNFQRAHPRRFHSADGLRERPSTPYFSAIDGLIDILLPSIAVGSSGAITAISNIMPRVCVQLWLLCQESRVSPERFEAAREMQELVSNVDYDVQKLGIPGMKALLHRFFGYSLAPRGPLPPTRLQVVDELLSKESFKRLMAIETDLGNAS